MQNKGARINDSTSIENKLVVAREAMRRASFIAHAKRNMMIAQSDSERRVIE